MQIRYPGVILTSLAMAFHAALVGRYLESVFFIIAFCWAWVAVTALRDRLQSAQSMVLTMMGLLLFLVLPIALVRLSSTTLVAHLSLAIVPGIVSWACMFIYIRHVRRQGENSGDAGYDDTDFDFARAMPIALAEFLPDPPPLEAAAAPVHAIVSSPPANTNERQSSDMQPVIKEHPAEELTVERVTEILASLRSLTAAREAA